MDEPELQAFTEKVGNCVHYLLSASDGDTARVDADAGRFFLWASTRRAPVTIDDHAQLVFEGLAPILEELGDFRLAWVLDLAPPTTATLQCVVSVYCRAPTVGGLPHDESDRRGTWRAVRHLFAPEVRAALRDGLRHERLSPEDRDDVVQLAWETLLERNTYPCTRHARAWLHSVAAHVMYDRWRRNNAKRRRPPAAPTEPDLVGGNDDSLRVLHAFRALATSRQQDLNEKLEPSLDGARLIADARAFIALEDGHVSAGYVVAYAMMIDPYVTSIRNAAKLLGRRESVVRGLYKAAEGFLVRYFGGGGP